MTLRFGVLLVQGHFDPFFTHSFISHLLLYYDIDFIRLPVRLNSPQLLTVYFQHYLGYLVVLFK